MQRRTRRIVLGVALIAALVAGGAAFTATATLPNTTAGYGTSTITGATATDIKYNLSADGTQINSVDLTFSGDISADNVSAGFDSNNLTSCTVGSYNSGTTSTPVTCSGYTESTASSASFHAAVTNN
jgi:hypothetical protein